MLILRKILNIILIFFYCITLNAYLNFKDKIYILEIGFQYLITVKPLLLKV